MQAPFALPTRSGLNAIGDLGPVIRIFVHQKVICLQHSRNLFISGSDLSWLIRFASDDPVSLQVMSSGLHSCIRWSITEKTNPSNDSVNLFLKMSSMNSKFTAV